MKRRYPLLVTAAFSLALAGAASNATAGHGKDKMGGMKKMDMAGGAASSSQEGANPMMGDMSEMMKNMGKMMQMMGRQGKAMDHAGTRGSSHVKDFSMFDADGDGDVTPEEVHAGLIHEMKTFDADNDGTLSLSEFEKLHVARNRHAIVDHFQHLDENGDGSVTEEEATAPTKMMMKAHKPEGHAPDPK